MSVAVYTSFEQICDSSGKPISGARVWVYDVGTTTLKEVFSDTALTIPAANPIICDSAGRHPMRYIDTGSYKVHLKTSAGASIRDAQDNIDTGIPAGAGALAIDDGGTGATTAAMALANLGGATSAELADVAADVAALSGALASVEKTHIATGTTAQRPSAPIAGDIRRNTTTSEFEGYNGTGWVDFTVNRVGAIVKSVFAEYTNNTDLSTIIPLDDTPPQISEGTQIISQSFTPTYANSKIRLRFRAIGQTQLDAHLIGAVFKNSDADCISVGMGEPSVANDTVALDLEAEYSPGSTSAITFTVRVGASAGVCRLNGTTTARRFGGKMGASLVIEEIKQ